jgi:hypothetical protein
VLRTILFALFIFNAVHAKQVNFISKTDFYNWIEKGKNAQSVDALTLQDGWSSREMEFISGEHFQDADFVYISQEFTNIKYLKFNLNSELTDHSLKNLQSIPFLQEIFFRETNFSDIGLLSLTQATPQLKALTFEGPHPRISGTTFKEVLKGLPNLRYLQIDRGYPHASNAMPWNNLAQALEDSQIEELVFANSYDLGKDKKIWSHTFLKMPYLQHIELSRMNEDQTQVVLEALQEGKPTLRELSLTATSINDKTTLPANLKTLRISGYIFSNDYPKLLTNLITAASDLPELETLDLIPCTYVQEPLLALEALILTKYRSLKTLYLHNSDTYKHVHTIGLSLKEKRPELEVFVDGKEIK